MPSGTRQGEKCWYCCDSKKSSGQEPSLLNSLKHKESGVTRRLLIDVVAYVIQAYECSRNRALKHTAHAFHLVGWTGLWWLTVRSAASGRRNSLERTIWRSKVGVTNGGQRQMNWTVGKARFCFCEAPWPANDIVGFLAPIVK
jgi:hypothetical protein